MEKTHLIFSSQTAAMKAKRILNMKNIKAIIVKTPQKYSKNGCSFSLEVENRNLALSVLKGYKITFEGEY